MSKTGRELYKVLEVMESWGRGFLGKNGEKLEGRVK